MKLDESQVKALEFALENKVTVISGAAGCGKSAVALEIEKQLKERGWGIIKCAPTGKAAMRIKGTTIHTMLGPDVVEDAYGNVKIKGFLREGFENNTAIIIDECSMIDQALWQEVEDCFDRSRDVKLILVGDDGQLEPVGDGQPFIDIINNRPNIVQKLTTVHRTADGNDIVDLAHAIRFGKEMKTMYNNVEVISKVDSIAKIKEDLLNYQAISPMRKGECGIHSINAIVQSQLLAEEKLGEKLFKNIEWDNDIRRWKEGSKTFYEKDKIIVTKNHFDLELTNGTIGTINGFGTMKFLNKKFNIFEDVEGIYINRDIDNAKLFIPISFAEKNIDHAYCISVHKAQGSEWKNVIFFATEDQSFMISNKKLLYTAVTRAREKLYLVN